MSGHLVSNATREVEEEVCDRDDEVEDEHRFEQSKVDFERFLNDESVVHDDNLVLLWGDKWVHAPPLYERGS